MQLTYKDYTALSTEEKQNYLLQISKGLTDFHFEKMNCFESFGQKMETGIFTYKDKSQFVFVPGDTVTLGWDEFAEGMNEHTRNDMEEDLEEYRIEDLDQFLRENTSAVRTATITSMLVEQKPREIGWYDVPIDSPKIIKEKMLADYLEKFLKNEKSSVYQILKTFKIKRNSDRTITTQLYSKISYAELLEKTRQDGFDLPTEDEWEYLCGCGSRTLWRWGDSFPDNMKVPHIKLNIEPTTSIECPNKFGLIIGFDPYLQEVTSGNTFLKGGDGGGFCCGGNGLSLSFFPTSTFYKGTSVEEDVLDYLKDIGGDYTIFRRVIRL